MLAVVRPMEVRYAAEGWGVGELWLLEGRLVHHELPSARAGRCEEHPLAERMRIYFRGEPVELGDVPIELDGATPFELSVVATLRRVPAGETVTYGELATLAGHPGAARAVGTLCAHNRHALVVPCHRVVAANGIGAYGSLGVEYKRRLLRLEGVSV